MYLTNGYYPDKRSHLWHVHFGCLICGALFWDPDPRNNRKDIALRARDIHRCSEPQASYGRPGLQEILSEEDIGKKPLKRTLEGKYGDVVYWAPDMGDTGRWVRHSDLPSENDEEACGNDYQGLASMMLQLVDGITDPSSQGPSPKQHYYRPWPCKYIFLPFQ